MTTPALMRLKLPIHDLVEEILDQLPDSVWQDPSTTFLDPAMAGGQFIRAIERRLKATGHSDHNIAGRVWGCEQRMIRVKYVKNWHKVISDNLYVMDVLTHDWGDMKFDVIVGNPPYQDQGGQNTLYPKIYAACVPLLKPQGHMCMVTPPAILPGLWGVKNPDGIRMPPPINIQRVTVGNKVKSHFPQIGVDICHWWLTNQPSDNKCVPVDVNGSIVDVSTPLIAKHTHGDAALTQQILEKCFAFNINYYKITSADHGKSAKPSQRGRDLAVEAISQDGSLKTRAITWLKQHPHYGSPKVMLAMYGRAAVVDRTHKLVSAAQDRSNGLTGHNVITVLTANDQVSDNLVKLLDSNLQKFLAWATADSRSPYVNFLHHFRGVDCSRSWTDKSLYKHFGLTPSEIAHVESNL